MKNSCRLPGGYCLGGCAQALKGSDLHLVDAQISRVIAMVEHPFRMIKRQFGNVKTCYCSESNAFYRFPRIASRASRARCSRETISSADLLQMKGFGFVLQQVVVDRILQIVDAGVTAPAYASGRDLREEAFNQVHPRCAGWREMQLEPRMLREPRLHFGRLVGRVVVEHQMHVARLEDGAAQEGQELFRPVARHAFTDDHARLHNERREQRRRAFPLVIVRHGGAAALLERQPRLGPVERLDLRLLVDAEHHRPVRRIEVEADDLGDLLLEHRVVRHLETFCQVRLETGFRPNAADARRRDAHRLGHQGSAPVRGIGRAFLHSLCDHLEVRLPGQRRHPGRPGLVAPEPGHTLAKIARLPAPDGGLGRSCAPHDLVGAPAVGCRQYDAGAPDNLPGRVAVGEQRFQLRTLGGARINADVLACHTSTLTHPQMGILRQAANTTEVSPKTTRYCPRCSRSATSSWYDSGSWHEDEAALKPSRRPNSGPEAAKSNDPSCGPGSDQAAIPALPSALIR